MTEKDISRDVLSHLKTIASRGKIAVGDPRHGALHGTSLESVRYVIKHGILPGNTAPDGINQSGDISVYPTPTILPAVEELGVKFPLQRLRQDPKASKKDAQDYAQLVGRDHGVLSTLGVPLERINELREEIDYLIHDNDREGFGSFSGDLVDQAREVGQRRKGFLLAFDPTVQHDLMEGDLGDFDLKIRREGDPFSYKRFSGIQALGPDEKAFQQQHFFPKIKK